MQNFHSASMDRLLYVISKLNTAEECRAFFEDLCTIKELQDMAQRFETAVLLDQGKNYNDISAAVGASTATISRVNRCRNYGSGGYRNAIQMIKDMEEARDDQ